MRHTTQPMRWLAITLTVLLFTPATALAGHAWGNYHWARTTASFDLIIVKSTTSDWDGYVGQAAYDWSTSAVLNMGVDEFGSTSKKTRRQCRSPNGKVRICNLAYGQTGWLGIAGITIDANGHITKGYTKLNDTYFSWAYYDTPKWRQSVTCQELGHNVGLDHQDEDFDNGPRYSCMDYQDPPFDGPNAHDYAQLETIYDPLYGHLDSYDSYYSEPDADDPDADDPSVCNAPPGKGCNKSGARGNNADIGWGISLGRRGQSETYLRIDPDGTRHVTHVTWAIGH